MTAPLAPPTSSTSPPDDPVAGARAVLLTGIWFASLAPALQDALLGCGAVRSFAAGDRLFGRGDAPCGLYAVLEGAVRATGLAAEGRQALLTLIEPPYWFGEIAAVDGLPRSHDATADTPARVFHVSQEALQGLLDHEPQLWRALGVLLAQKLRLALGAIDESALLPAAARVARRLLLIARDYGERPGGARRVISVRQEQLAMMLSLSRQTTNQILRDLEVRGIAALTRGEIEILDLEALHRAAGV